jgi:uncharacterized membrane protein
VKPDPDTNVELMSSVAQDVALATSQLRAEHRQETSALQKAVDCLTAFVGWPGFVAALAGAIGLWIAANLLAGRWGIRPLDLPPFAWLQVAISAGALFVAVLILTTQRREDQLAGHRLQLILELSILNDRKISKVIELIEEVRRDSPTIVDRVDGEANSMSTPSDTHAVLKAIKDVPDKLGL